MGGTSSVLAVVDAGATESVIWWVNLGASGGLTGRLCGAWVLADAEPATLPDLLSGRIVLSTMAGRPAVERSGVAGRGVDIGGTLAAVAGARDALQAAYEAKAATTTASKAPVPPTWPDLPAVLDPENPPPVDAPGPLRRALGIARWFDGLCRTWDQIEGQRLVRPYLRAGREDVRRELPVVLLGDRPASR